MASQYHDRPSALVDLGKSDSYAAYCFDEAVYFFGNYVESQLNEASARAKNGKDAQRARAQRLGMVIQECEYRLQQFDEEVRARDAAPTGDGGLPPDYDPTDPVSPETAKKMPPAVKFTGRKFADPANLFKRAEERRVEGEGSST
jgi:hypothetical protein